MPTYDYECDACPHRFEAFQRMADAPLAECPACGGPVRRMVGAGAGLLFKGSGFYQTDYRSAGYKQAAAAEKPAGKPAGAAPKKSEKTASLAKGKTAE